MFDSDSAAHVHSLQMDVFVALICDLPDTSDSLRTRSDGDNSLAL